MDTKINEIECQALVKTLNMDTAIAMEEIMDQDNARSSVHNVPHNGNNSQSPVETPSEIMKPSTSGELEPVREHANSTSPGNN